MGIFGLYFAIFIFFWNPMLITFFLPRYELHTENAQSYAKNLHAKNAITNILPVYTGMITTTIVNSTFIYINTAGWILLKKLESLMTGTDRVSRFKFTNMLTVSRTLEWTEINRVARFKFTNMFTAWYQYIDSMNEWIGMNRFEYIYVTTFYNHKHK